MSAIWEVIWSWETLWWLLMILYIPSCIGLITVVLLQKGKGTGFAGAFGMGGGSDTVFGPRAGQSLPMRLTHLAAALFMILAIVISLITPRLHKGIAPELDTVSAANPLDQLGLQVVDEEGVVTTTTPVTVTGVSTETPETSTDTTVPEDSSASGGDTSPGVETSETPQ